MAQIHLKIDDIKQVAFFGDSYCFDTVTRRRMNGTDSAFYPPTASYMDIFAERFNLEIVHVGTTAHGPNWMVHEFREWCKEKSQQYLNETHFVFLWSDQSREIMPNSGDLWENGNSHEELLHPGERALPGPDTPMLHDPERYDQRVRLAIQLYWTYLKPKFEPIGSGEHYRQLTICRDAWKYYLQQYNITSYQQYHCFFHTAEHENNFLSFQFNDNTHLCLQHFAHSHDDYVQGENRDLDPLKHDHYNHFSPKGQYNMADVLTEKFKEIHG